MMAALVSKECLTGGQLSLRETWGGAVCRRETNGRV